MKLVKILLASTFTLAAATTFAASANSTQEQDKIVVSTQEAPVSGAPESAAGQPTADQPGSENAAEAQGQPAQPAQ